ncbi:hypothetical protein ISN45_Aa03g008640 [Arabidopsis thaliana x Arabidopsis arenosa]|uniref:Uncharacterized protein n=2 Tax=Arabidopsis TaxID=3701 RepID=A0A8T2B2X0_ARASU|nr:hypothetical protein ISN45_Aa03g008640 [Arabidopsis thaliana x Arabidopsis arenosa]KAG7581298.1 hypothetical protein ISN44_As08g010030 [Arabidopsis suecica]
MASGYNQYTAMAVFATMTLSSVFTASAQYYDSEPQTGASCFPGMSIIMIISSLILSGFAILRW